MSVTTNDLKGVSMIALEAIYKTLRESQTILQLLVEKNIITSEEVNAMRRKVDSNSPSVKSAKFQLDMITNAFDEDQFQQDRDLDKFEDLFSKMLIDKNSVSSEEREFMLKQLDKIQGRGK